MPVTSPVHSLAEYENAVANLNYIHDTHIRLYRGQRDQWALLPSLFRKYRSQVELIDRKEQDALEMLKTLIPTNTPMRPTNDWDWLSFGQHYGLLTRMLDWSEMTETALFFAVEDAEDPPVKPTVYVYHAKKVQIVKDEDKSHAPAEVLEREQKTWIMTPSVHSARVGLQKGWHTVHRLHSRKAGGKRVIALADMEWHKGRMQTISIDPASAENTFTVTNVPVS